VRGRDAAVWLSFAQPVGSPSNYHRVVYTVPCYFLQFLQFLPTVPTVPSYRYQKTLTDIGELVGGTIIIHHPTSLTKFQYC
jgi:hypothetical protein